MVAIRGDGRHHEGHGGSEGVEHRLAAGRDGPRVDRVGFDRRLLDAGRQELKRRVAYVAVIPVHGRQPPISEKSETISITYSMGHSDSHP